MDNNATKFIAHAIEIGALELLPEGRVLKSGRLSPYFFNSGLFRTGNALKRLARAYAAAIFNSKMLTEAEVIFGPAYKGIPLACATAMELITYGIEVEYSFNRKEAKDHGEGGLLVGAELTNKRILIIDDVITDGATKSEALDIVRSEGGIPVGLVIAFDRHERATDSSLSAAQRFSEKHRLPVVAIASVVDVAHYLNSVDAVLPPGIDRITMAELVHTYSHEYGV